MSWRLLPGSARLEQVGESPQWWARRGLLLTVDILGQAVRARTLDGDEVFALRTPAPVGFVVPASDGSLVVALPDGLYRLDPVGGGLDRLTWEDPDGGRVRINDGKVDSAGRIWAGTMDNGEKEPIGRLFSFDGTVVETRATGSVVSNGIAWSPDDRILYYADSGRGVITAYDVDPASGALENERRFVTDEEGRSDGLTVDADGDVWSAKWEGGLVVRYGPDGAEVERIELPVRRITSCAFVGEGLRTLAVTSAISPDRDEPEAGGVFLLDVGARGRSEPEFRIQ